MQAFDPVRPERLFIGSAAALFVLSAAVTVAWCGSMAPMDGMEMPGGWSMSMAWMRMPGQTWAGAAASFLGMWSVMMVAMMLPSLLPMLRRYRDALGGAAQPRLERLTLLAALGYFAVWSALGLAVFPAGVALGAAAIRFPALARAAPVAAAVLVLAVGALQFSAWKARQLDCCREAPRRGRADAGGAWRHGLQLGLRCCRCCAGPTAMLLGLGVMDLWTMAAVTAAISAERLAPAGARVARAVGTVILAAGLVLLGRAALK